jgi:deoxyadenosine/deoxycytidine kinase
MLEKNIPLPDLIIYLTASPDILMQRVKTRGRGYEKFMDIEYLAELSEAYSKYFFHFNQTPLLVVNTENVNFTTEPELFQSLIEEIENIKPGTSYLVPTRSE